MLGRSLQIAVTSWSEEGWVCNLTVSPVGWGVRGTAQLRQTWWGGAGLCCMLLSAQPLWLLGKNGSFPSHGLIMRTVKLCRNRAYSLVCVPSCLLKGRRFDKPSSLSALLDALQDPWAASLWERPLPGSWLVQYSGGLNPAYRQPPIWHSSLSFWPLFKYISMWIATLWKVVVLLSWKTGTSCFVPLWTLFRVP